MKPEKKIGLFAILGIAVISLLDSLFIVPQTGQAIVIQFGDPKRVVQEPGLHVKVPFIQRLVMYDNRLLSLDPPAKEVLLADKKRGIALQTAEMLNPLLKQVFSTLSGDDEEETE